MTNNYFKVAGNTEVRILSELFFFDDTDRDSIDSAYERALANVEKRTKAQREAQLSISAFRAFKTKSKGRGTALVGFDGPYNLNAVLLDRPHCIEANRRFSYEWAAA